MVDWKVEIFNGWFASLIIVDLYSLLDFIGSKTRSNGVQVFKLQGITDLPDMDPIEPSNDLKRFKLQRFERHS